MVATAAVAEFPFVSGVLVLGAPLVRRAAVHPVRAYGCGQPGAGCFLGQRRAWVEGGGGNAPPNITAHVGSAGVVVYTLPGLSVGGSGALPPRLTLPAVGGSGA